MKFKVGDEVKFKDELVGGITDVTLGKSYKLIEVKGSIVKFLDDVGDERSRNDYEVILVEKTLSNLEVGDIVLDNEGDERFVMGVNGKVVVLSDDEKEAEEYFNCEEFTIKKMEREGFKVKQEVEEDETIEIEGTKYKASEIKDALKKAKK